MLAESECGFNVRKVIGAVAARRIQSDTALDVRLTFDTAEAK